MTTKEKVCVKTKMTTNKNEFNINDLKNSPSKKILIVSGGTGGHIFPAIVLGNDLKKFGHEIFFMCGSRPLEQEIYKASNISPYVIELAGSPLGAGNIKKNFGRVIDLIKSFRKISAHIKNLKPDLIILFGGYISFIPLIIARLKKIPVILHEQNAVAGRVTRIAEKLGVQILTAWPECRGIKNFNYFGVPVREPVRISRDEALKLLDLENFVKPSQKIIGITGGSLGSAPLRELLIKTAALCEEFAFIFLSSAEIKNDGNKHFLKSRWDMNTFYSACDVLICRSGGSTLAEAIKWNIPTITIAWPQSAEHHQEYNAIEFTKIFPKGRSFNENGAPENLASLIKNVLTAKNEKHNYI